MDILDWIRLALCGLLFGAFVLLLFALWTGLRDSDYDH